MLVTGDHDTHTVVYKNVIIYRADLKTIHEDAKVIMIRQIADSVEPNSLAFLW